ncbi:MAG: bifunctional diguanylate cyclase/phosphodiesterase [Gammaproteobacteria bacterium]|jgi:diguanylate cyclase (GGDEF)-like protein|nr:bifunctional diguanylate cyclase/phosphodiesterase [Gammaproteobacteria bacterium]MDP6616220.1 bifunctional diguanylate cyclase/phosphodiesterase [Gammaproteobacteria bacterium]MDP6695572.1 bifunctional diguanylate cyclase/phosphodiesterase [Gammaproteobacteria bacterium]
MATRIKNLSELLVEIDRLRSGAAGASVGLMIGELQGLKKINARHGYGTGDAAIEVFHERIRGVVHDSDLLVRINGKKFALIVSDASHDGHALATAEKIASLAEEWIVIKDVRLRLTVNMGVSLFPSLADSPEVLLAQAEAALERCIALHERFILWRPDINNGSAVQTHPLFDAKSAIDNGEFRLHYQPKVDLQSGDTVGAEVLVRWQSMDGLIAPGSFLNEIERSRTVAPLLRFVVNSASREMARWIRWAPDFTVAINATPTDIEDIDLVDVLADVLDMWGLDPKHLILELTETTLMHDIDKGIETLQKLREFGVRTSIDDFGTGYSSLAYLRQLPVDEIKIDRSFVLRILEDETDQHIVESLVALAQAMGLRVVAEGIESKAVAIALAGMGCDLGQGFHFGHPVIAREFEDRWLRGNHGQSSASA